MTTDFTNAESLTDHERKLAQTLAIDPTHTYSKDQLALAVFGQVTPRYLGQIDKLAVSLRTKLEGDHVILERGFGYRMNPAK